MSKKDILIIESLADFEKKINRDQQPYDINMMVMPGTLEDKHKECRSRKRYPGSAPAIQPCLYFTRWRA